MSQEQIDKLEEAIHRLESAVALQGQQLQQNSKQLARLTELVAGNGEGRSLAVRVIGAEQKAEVHRQQITELITRVTFLSEQQRAWRNQAIGISAAVSLLWILGLAFWNIIIHLP